MSVQAKAPVFIPLSATAHLKGCPSVRERIEYFEATRQKDHEIVTVVRCCDCGGQEVHEGNIARVAHQLNEDGASDGRREKQEK
jgi:cytochrome c-type biogenesis protein CcmH/NrfF